jgi:hypothetical protein
MQTVTSEDGSRIAYERYGEGPTVILVGGALAYRRLATVTDPDGNVLGLLQDR